MESPLSDREMIELRAIAETDQFVTANNEYITYRPTGMLLVQALEYIERANTDMLRREQEWIVAGRPFVSIGGFTWPERD